ncbi:hypothetical protein PROFUN_07793 [Planoprotostelium fungivorum]|uniref:Rap-GAP domain-containing protein n=1 Tax=Planoprotostelium fungivorum TaxID=1890364 RepID=A0A2P6MX48_9EUKA|nr:hypothetical protein PROFUN_07793 [Planoprotostelium fungivorum]
MSLRKVQLLDKQTGGSTDDLVELLTHSKFEESDLKMTEDTPEAPSFEEVLTDEDDEGSYLVERPNEELKSPLSDPIAKRPRPRPKSVSVSTGNSNPLVVNTITRRRRFVLSELDGADVNVENLTTEQLLQLDEVVNKNEKGALENLIASFKQEGPAHPASDRHGGQLSPPMDKKKSSELTELRQMRNDWRRSRHVTTREGTMIGITKSDGMPGLAKKILGGKERGMQQSSSATNISAKVRASSSLSTSPTSVKSPLMSSEKHKGDFVTVQDVRLERIPLSHVQSSVQEESKQAVHCRDFWLELGKVYQQFSYCVPRLEDTDKYEKYYLKEFYGQKHMHYVGSTENKELVIVSVREVEDAADKTTHFICLYRNYTKVMFETSRSGVASKKVKGALQLITQCKKMNKIDSNANFDLNLLKFEGKMVVTHQKIGVLLRLKGQTTENDMFNNRENASPDFEEFLQFLGDRVELQGHAGFAGGLDVKKNTTGTASVYTVFHDLEVMFHVSTLLPHFPADPQQVEKKRHIGNDIVVIIFNEADEPFDPSIMRSEYNNVYVFIQPVKEPGIATRYGVTVASKGGTPPFGPLLTSPPIYQKNSAFRNFLLTKVINAERASFEAPSFAPKIKRTRKILIEELVSNCKK